MKSFILAITLLAGVVSQASLLSFEPGNLQIEGVTLNKTALLTNKMELHLH